jgi:hypothetical protein
MRILIGRKYGGPIAFPLTNGWTDWELSEVAVPLRAGVNSISLACRSESHDTCHVNIDWIEVRPLSTGMPGK